MASFYHELKIETINRTLISFAFIISLLTNAIPERTMLASFMTA